MATGLSAAIKRALSSISPKLFEDEKLSENATYRRYESTAYDESKGHAVDTYADFPVRALLLTLGVGGQQFGETALAGVKATIMVRQSEFPEGFDWMAALRDKVTFRGRQFDIKKMEPILDEMFSIEMES